MQSNEKLVSNLLKNHQHIIGNLPADTNPQELIERIVSYYEDIIRCMPGNVFWIDKNDTHLGCNDNVLRMLGMKDLNEFKGLNFDIMGAMAGWSQDAIESFKRDTAEVIRTGIPKLNINEPPIPHIDGRIIYFLTSRVPLFDKNHNVIGIVGISIDITQLRNTQAELNKAKEDAEFASKMKSDFIMNMSHDVKTPLVGIIGLSELLAEKLTGTTHEFATELNRSGHQLLQFFNRCLDAFKIENHKKTEVNQEIDLQKTIDEMNDLFTPIIRTKNLYLQLKISEDVPRKVLGDKSSLHGILINLISNAVKFTNEGGVDLTIEVKCQTQDTFFINFTIKDTGIGIEKNNQSIIFDRFTRVVPSFKGIHEGTGIGLFIVKNLVTNMGGTITVESETGNGSQFIVTLPFAPNQNHQDTHDASSLKLKNQEHLTLSGHPIRLKILLVEDNPTAQLIQKTLFNCESCDIACVRSGEDALVAFSQQPYDLIILDIGLPGIQGDVVTKKIRAHESAHAFKPAKIIGLTAHITDNLKTLCIERGMDDLLSKPISREKAMTLIAGMMK